MNKSIYFSILNQGWISSEIAIKLPRWLAECPYNIYYESSTLRPISNNRNTIVKNFLASDKEYLLMLDADVVPKQNPLSLVEYEKDVISCPVPIYQHTIFLNTYQKEQDYLIPVEYDSSKKGLFEIDATGTGCILISRKVLETIKKPFERQFDEDGIELMGLDIFFSQKVKEAGFQIFTHFDYLSKHIKEINLGLFLENN